MSDYSELIEALGHPCPSRPARQCNRERLNAQKALRKLTKPILPEEVQAIVGKLEAWADMSAYPGVVSIRAAASLLARLSTELESAKRQYENTFGHSAYVEIERDAARSERDTLRATIAQVREYAEDSWTTEVTHESPHGCEFDTPEEVQVVNARELLSLLGNAPKKATNPCDALKHEPWCRTDRPCAYNLPPERIKAETLPGATGGFVDSLGPFAPAPAQPRCTFPGMRATGEDNQRDAQRAGKA
jgi:hypothetical protein